ncbi:MAG: 50S ribosomal protein L32e [Candidatus Thorarchaeota archaeon]|nr:50S ribosomal protein L32e [Candidatus Thorarchaeota archaeon]
MSEKSKTTKSKTKKTEDTPKEPKKTTTKKTTTKKTTTKKTTTKKTTAKKAEAAPKSKTSSKKTTTKKKTTAKKSEAKEEKPKAAKKKTTAKKSEAKEEKPKAAKKKTTTKKSTKAEAAKPKKAPAKKTKAKEEKPKAAAKKTTAKAKTTTKTKPKKKASAKAKPKAKPKGPLTREMVLKSREFRIAQAMRHRQPAFRHDQAHRWIRVKDSWRKVRGIDSPTRQKRRGRIAMVEAGFRKPKLVRGLHPSGFVEVLVYRPADLDGLNPDIHAVRIARTVGSRKRQDIIKKAETMMIRVLNAGTPESIMEEDLFTELDGIDMEVGTR